MMIRTRIESNTVMLFIRGISWVNTWTTCMIGPVPSFGTPNMAGTWPSATWIPTPVRNPIRTARERKSAIKPSFRIRERIKKAAARRATMPASAIYWGESGTAMVTSVVARIAAVAESAPTTRWREDPKRANTAIGIRMV